jgi:sodium-dependent dicarboxylate transporter 2/3/5
MLASVPPCANPAMSEDVPTKKTFFSNKLALGATSVFAAVLTAWLFFPATDGPRNMTFVAVLMALFWVFEVVPLAVTSLFPLVLLPGLGVVGIKATSASYGKPTIFLFLGGFILALGLQRSGLHRRIALRIVATIGSQPDRLLLGFMVATAFLSMWISNTATVMVCMPIALSVLEEAKARGANAKQVGILGTAIMLGIAYAADIGGMATPVGTPPNLVLMEMQEKLLPDLPEVAFNQWVMMGFPFALVFLACGWWMLSRLIFKLEADPVFEESDALKNTLASLGKMRRDEWISGGVFFCVALLWMTGSSLKLGQWGTIPGWRTLLNLPEFKDASVAVLGGILLFMIPSSENQGERLMTWDFARKKVPWGLLLLFGGGFALAAGFQSSGLSAAIGGALTSLKGVPTLVMVGAVSLVITFLTELTSNTATTTLVLPILAKGGVALGIDPRILMIPATLSASCAFMMPVASPTQAIVFGSGHVTIKQMVRAGIYFNLFGVVWTTLYFWLVGAPIFGISL